jgi:hypothetical protein
MGGLKSAFKSVSKVVSAPFVEPVKAVQKAAEGDYYGALNSVVKTASLGTLGLPSVKMSDTGGDSSVDSLVEEPMQKLETAKEESKKRRKALYATQGGALGEEVEKVGGTFGNARGTLFGN